jgi:arginyl-tRNA synthetase
MIEMIYADPMGAIEKDILISLSNILEGMGFRELEPVLETPPEDMGDFSYSCFALAKSARKTPQALAEEIANCISLPPEIGKCEHRGPYVNFFVNPHTLAENTLNAVLELKEDFGKSEPSGVRIVLEHTSANPTDRLHIGRVRNPIIGDTLARILRKAGYDVETQYYVDDMGRQAITLAYGKKIYDYTESPEEITPEDWEKWQIIKNTSMGPYQSGSTAIETFTWAKDESEAWQNRLERGEESTTKYVRIITDETMEEKIKPTLKRINVNVDNFVHESGFLSDTNRIVEKLKASELCGQEDGAFYLDLNEFGVDNKFFFLRADGTTLYATRDIAYHLWKARRGDVLINVLGEDHKLEAKYVTETIRNVLKEEVNIEVIFYSFVSLPEGKMSTRKGKVVFMDDLLDEAVTRAEQEVRKRRIDIPEKLVKEIAEIVGIGAVRYNLVNIQPEKKIVFRWEDALNFEGTSAPFIQYAHARARSILRKGENQGLIGFNRYDAALLEHASEAALIREMARFPGLVKECAKTRRPHTMASYTYRLAAQFNQFYRDCPVLACDDPELGNARLVLVNAARIVMAGALDCLGIEAPNEM